MSSISRCNNREVTELTWENGHISMHGLEGGINEAQGNTLESIVNQASCLNFPSSSYQKWEPINSMNATPSHIHVHDQVKATNLGGKRGRSCDFQVEEISACGSASAAFCRDVNDPTMMTWASFESPKSLKTPRLANDDDRDSHYHDCSEGAKEESYRSQSSSRRSRAAAVHNLSERRRRDRINQKMKTLQKLVPNASKTDKASMLDEVIEYLKQLQAQVHMMSNARNMPQMMMPNLGMQQLQMSLLARMSMGMGMAGMGMGMLDANNLPRNLPHPAFPNSLMHASAPLGGATPSFVPPPFTMPPMIPPPMPVKPNVDASTPVPNFNDAYNTFIAQQSMNMDFLNKMSALYRQQQPSKKPISLSTLPNHSQGD